LSQLSGVFVVASAWSGWREGGDTIKKPCFIGLAMDSVWRHYGLTLKKVCLVLI